MNKPTWQQIQEGLKSEYKAPDNRDASEFWTDFRARASLVNQTEESASAPQPLQWHRPMWAIATAAIIMVIFVFSPALRNNDPSQPATLLAEHSEVQEIEVFVPYSSMMIMQDAESGTSVVWLTDVEMTDTPISEG